MSAGLSGAGVYRVDANGRAFVLKIAGENESLDAWRRKAHIQQLAANAALAPAIVHIDETRHAVVSAFVVDRMFMGLYVNPATHGAAVEQLGKTIRRVHDLAMPPDAEPADAGDRLRGVWSGLAPTIPLPPFVGDAVQRVLTEDAPPRERPLVLSHNDVNLTNLVYDGEHLMLLDWEVAAPNDPFYDLATVAVFLRMDEETCRRLIAAHDDEPAAALPARFAHNRRVVSVLAGTMFLYMGRQSGHAGATGTETLASTPSLSEVYQRMRAGALNAATADGQWWFGLALIKESLAL